MARKLIHVPRSGVVFTSGEPLPQKQVVYTNGQYAKEESKTVEVQQEPSPRPVTSLPPRQVVEEKSTDISKYQNFIINFKKALSAAILMTIGGLVIYFYDKSEGPTYYSLMHARPYMAKLVKGIQKLCPDQEEQTDECIIYIHSFFQNR